MYPPTHTHTLLVYAIADNLSRARLRPSGEDGSEYINASFIDVSGTGVVCELKSIVCTYTCLCNMFGACMSTCNNWSQWCIYKYVRSLSEVR